MHKETHPLAGKTVKLKDGVKDSHNNDVSGAEYRIEDWWDHLTGGSWMFADGNPAAIQYAVRAAVRELPLDDEVLYGKIGAFGHLIHATEIEDE